ncbi:MAG: PSD1 and planctomycete cytochrome C domain-containing protein [Chthoniobacter sp.]|nr:PSD1 and planctomycete cytochrome C domain-containing protein [Chthoniobacter sp.]
MRPPKYHSLLTRPLCAVLAMAAGARAADDGALFESKIRPLLVDRCYECHSTEKKQKAGLVLDSKAGWEKGGDSGTPIVPGKPEESLLLKAVRWTDKDLQMPPEKAGGKLTDAQIADLEAWIKTGAFDPRTNAALAPAKKGWAEIFAERKQWWSLQPLRAVDPPAEGDAEWSADGVDRLLRARMKAEGVIPSPKADAQTLIRRATLVLTGLPPSAPEVDAFIEASKNDPASAYAALVVDRLLASPHFGECFARHWLDVVRFTETHGNEWNYDVAYAWRYRDYAIRAFNGDVPYDQFVREQIAGDLVASPRWNAAGRFNESAIGTAFYRFGEVNHDSCAKFGAIGYDIADNQLDTLTKTFQATTVACARCHDHKLDAVSTKDYHALLAILRSTRLVQHTLDSPEVNRDTMSTLQARKPELRSELAAVWRAEAAALDASKLQALATKDKPPDLSHPLRAWFVACQPGAQNVAEVWAKVAANHARIFAERTEFNETKFTTLADFRHGIPAGWHTDGMGLRDGAGTGGDFAVAPEGAAALKMLLPAGAFTFALSDKLNGALRSPTLQRTHAKVSFEVVGGRFSLAHLVFNNCQLNYNHQQSLHQDGWSWVTVDFPEDSDSLHPYAELLTFWDNPKFPDPLGKLGKDTENQRGPWADYAKNPRTWWGVRRIVLHDSAETPKDELGYLSRLFAGAAPQSAEEAAARYAAIASDAVEAFAANRATDDDVHWLDWMLQSGLLSNRADATPRLAELIAKYREVENTIPPPTMMPGVADEGAGFTQPVLLHGDYTRPGEPVERAFVQALTPAGFTLSPQGSGRAELAQLIASPDNPLTARVMVNRVWQWVFGRGLVATPDDFGHLGERPSHPELLDHLAARFIAEGWSVKKLVRALLMSRAFQSTSTPTAEARQRDPQNVLLSHYSARRVEAEVIRDSILAVSGRLDARLYGPSIHPYRETADPDKRLFVGPLDGDGRRSIYLKFQLMEAPRFLSAFNLPGGKVTQGRRDTSNSPTQSLALLNDPFVLAMADFWSARLVADGRTSAADRVDALFREALGRAPSDADRESCLAAVRSLAATHGVAEADILASRAVWKDAAHMMFNLKEFIFIP